ncbi:hypothetical protein VNO80_09420 [Phaseolus coccineus]|uniref:Uncharacterized protein n=1 Tax=Phaseolus coccineus TaxID=3886 RepID=A0AAN9NBF0_PHACN
MLNDRKKNAINVIFDDNCCIHHQCWFIFLAFSNNTVFAAKNNSNTILLNCLYFLQHWMEKESVAFQTLKFIEHVGSLLFVTAVMHNCYEPKKVASPQLV